MHYPLRRGLYGVLETALFSFGSVHLLMEYLREVGTAEPVARPPTLGIIRGTLSLRDTWTLPSSSTAQLRIRPRVTS